MFLVTHEEGKKNFYLEELKLFLVKGSVGRLAGGIISAPCQDRLTPCPLLPSARPRMNDDDMMMMRRLKYFIVNPGIMFDFMILYDIDYESDGIKGENN